MCSFAGVPRIFFSFFCALTLVCAAQQTPTIERIETANELDHEFDAGSRITIGALTPVQVDNLVMLGKVWGFLKYYHPAVTSGNFQWDYQLFRILPAILAAADHASANAALAHWIDNLGAVVPCDPCAESGDSDPPLQPDLAWTKNVGVLGRDLSDRLQGIFDNRLPKKQFYLSLTKLGNPSFEQELSYATVKFPDSGFQLLALYRFWNIIEYWSPYRDVLGEDWNAVLAEFIPRIAMAKDSQAYKQELLALIAKAHDGHANLWGSLGVRPPTGSCRLPITVRFIESLLVITGLDPGPAGDAVGLEVGDVISVLDGKPVSNLIDEWKPYYSGSNDFARMRDIARYMTRGECAESEIAVRRGNQDLKLKVRRIPSKPDSSPFTHDLPGPTFRLLSKDVAYLKLSSVKISECPQYIQQADGTKGLIIDIRNYPSEFVVFALGSHLVDTQTPFARFTAGDLSNPGMFHWIVNESLSPALPHYFGKVVILVDEVSLSQAEYTAMALRSARNAIVVGSTTAGADGNVSPFTLPGNLRTMISGIGVFYPDKTPTQRIGIVPNAQATPTIIGIRERRDEVLEEAVRQILGKGATQVEIEKITRP